MASYQDLEQRVITLESKIKFIMEVCPVKVRRESKVSPNGYIEQDISLFELYTLMNNLGAKIAVTEEPKVEENGTE